MNGFTPYFQTRYDRSRLVLLRFPLVTGDAYVDHPSFGTAIISRVLEDAGYRVAILSQPDFTRVTHDFSKPWASPRYAVLINAGNIDSMVAHYTSAKKRRSDDAYTPGGVGGKRPDRAVTVYSMLARARVSGYAGLSSAALKPVCADLRTTITGLTALCRPILESTGADGVMFGMGEHSVVELANNLKHGKKGADACKGVRGAADWLHNDRTIWSIDAVECPSYRGCRPTSRTTRSVKIQYDEQDAVRGKAILQRHGKRILVQTRRKPLTTEENGPVFMRCRICELIIRPTKRSAAYPPFRRCEFSIIHNRGCFGACNFCALAFHQGRYIQVRSHESVIEEAKKITADARLQGLHPRCRRPDREFPLSGLQKAGEIRLLQGQALSVPNHLPEHRSRPHRLP